MTDRRSPLDAALDLVLFVPVGLALTVGEEIPKLAAKGRSVLTSRVSTARVVGQFAVAQGRRQVDGRLRADTPPPHRRPSSPSGAAPTRPGAASRPAPAPPVPSTGAASAQATGPGSEATASRPAPIASERSGAAKAAAPAPAVTGGSASPPSSPLAGHAANGAGGTSSPAAGSLGIPGYDSLSASQVVQRLAGLSSTELEAVKVYEAANRGRRTILARVGQLQAG